MAINKCFLAGNLTRDAEIRTTQAGTSILSFGLAVNDRVQNKSTGEWEDRPNYFDCVVFGTRGEKIAQYLSKGMRVFVEGRLRWSSWEKDGQKRSKIEVIVDDIVFGSSGQRQTAQPQAQRPVQQQAQPAQQQPADDYSMYDEDIPF